MDLLTFVYLLVMLLDLVNFNFNFNFDLKSIKVFVCSYQPINETIELTHPIEIEMIIN